MGLTAPALTLKLHEKAFKCRSAAPTSAYRNDERGRAAALVQQACLLWKTPDLETPIVKTPIVKTSNAGLLAFAEEDFFDVFQRVTRGIQLSDNMKALKDGLRIQSMTMFGSQGLLNQSHGGVLVQDLTRDATFLDNLAALVKSGLCAFLYHGNGLFLAPRQGLKLILLSEATPICIVKNHIFPTLKQDQRWRSKTSKSKQWPLTIILDDLYPQPMPRLEGPIILELRRV